MATTATPPPILQLNTRVVVSAGPGVISFVGQTSFATGKWVGVTLDDFNGKNDGSVAGRRYFTCEEGKGVFVRSSQVRLLVGDQPLDRAESPTPSRPVTRPPSTAPSLTATSRPSASRQSSSSSQAASRPSGSLPTPTPRRPSVARATSPTKPALGTATSRLGTRKPPIASAIPPPTPSAVRRPPSSAASGPSRPPSTTSGLMSPRQAIGRSQASQFAPARPPAAAATGLGSLAGLRAVSPRKSMAGVMTTAASARMARGLSGASSASAASGGGRGSVMSPPLRTTSALSSASARSAAGGTRTLGLGLTSTGMRREGSGVSDASGRSQPRVVEEEVESPGEDGDSLENEQPPAADEDNDDEPTAVIIPKPASPIMANPFSLREEVKPTEPTVTKREHEELLSKLRILEARRAEDRERLRESDRLRDEAAEWERVREKSKAKIVELSNDVRELKRANMALTHAKDESETQFADLQDQVELSVLDKEVAEERVEAAEAALMAEKERISEMETELAVWREENARMEALAAQGGAGSGEGGEGDPVKSALAYVQLEKQNLRLKDALVRLRELMSETEAEQRRRIGDLEKELDLTEDLQREFDNTAVALERSEAQVEDLKGQLDDALGAEDLLEQLTERNLSLSEKLEEMAAELEDLEALKELNDELEESHVETEKQLQDELDFKDLVTREQQAIVERLEENVADYEGTISQFRELVLSLQADLEQVREHQASQQTESESLTSQSQAMLNLNLKLQASARRGQVKTVDLELRKLDAAQATEHLAMVKPYLLPAYFDEDAKSVEALLFFARLSAKAELLSLVLAQQNDVTEALNSTVPDHLVGVCETRSKLARFSALNKRFAAQLRRCAPAEFIRLGQAFGEVVPAEKRLDFFVDSLRKEELRAAECAKELDGFIALEEHLAEQHLAQETELDLAERTMAQIAGLDLDFDTIAAAAGYTKQALAVVSQDKEVTLEVGDANLDDAVFKPLQNLVNLARNAKVVAKKMVRRVDDLAAQSSALGLEYAAGFETLAFNSSAIAAAAARLAAEVGAYVADVRSSKSAFELSSVVLFAAEVAATELGRKSARPLDEMGALLSQLVADMGTALAAALDPDHSVKLAFDPPWLARVGVLHSTAATNLEAAHQVSVLNGQLGQLSRDLRTKDEAHQESAVKIELLERRMEQGRKQAEALAALEAELAKSRKQEKAYEEAIEALQGDLDAMEADNGRLKTAAAAAPAPGHSPALGTGDHAGDGAPATTYEGNMETSYLLDQIESLRAAVRFLRAQSSYLQSQAMLSTLSDLPTYSLPPTPPASPPPAPLGLPATVSVLPSLAQLGPRQATREKQAVWREVRQLAATPRLVDLAQVAKPKDVGGVKIRGWQSRAQGAEGQWEAEKGRWKEVSKRVERLVDLGGR